MYRPILLGWIFAGLLTGSIVVGILAASGVLARAPTPPVAVQPGVATSKPPAAAPEVDPDPDLPPVKPKAAAQPTFSDEAIQRAKAKDSTKVDWAALSDAQREAILLDGASTYKIQMKILAQWTVEAVDEIRAAGVKDVDPWEIVAGLSEIGKGGHGDYLRVLYLYTCLL
ncbi:MAG: hypothetical protein IMZ55_05275, partial [Acidobacteria bacterium]|nr:hypothetical protein [Acidobacteriota bacterium]